jgi:hypothetical protein
MPPTPEEAVRAMRQAKVSARRRKVAQPTPEQQKYLGLIRELTDSSVIMVVKVATCDCNHKEDCKVFQQAKAIAQTIEKLQEIRPEGVKGGQGGSGV